MPLVHVEEVMGTGVAFDLGRADLSIPATRAALYEACLMLHRADVLFSTYNETSALCRVHAGELELNAAPRELNEVLDSCAELRNLTRGCFDPWVMPGGLDPSGYVKGWAVECARAVLLRAGLDSAMINAGGDIATFGAPELGGPWVIGVRDPFDLAGICVSLVSPGAVATSGSYARGQHLLDPRTGLVPQVAVSATVIGADLARCDALATALYVAGKDGLSFVEDAGCEGFVIDQRNVWSMSRAFSDYLVGGAD